MNTRVAVLQLPGSNCEYETVRALEAQGINVDLVRWTAPAETVLDYQGIVIPGGFSFQDRIRAGVIAAALPIIQVLKEADKRGILILGICNGCQILAESGIVPNIGGHYEIEMALAENRDQDQLKGFICDWVSVRFQNPSHCQLTHSFNSESVIPIPINHGEGCFRFSEAIVDSLDQVMQLHYCDENGNATLNANPNGSQFNIAGISNKTGNAMAIMPHPERAAFLKQLPNWMPIDKNNDQTQGPWQSVFTAFSERIVA